MLSFTLQTNAQVPLTANVFDQLGEVAQTESTLWSVADESVAGLDSTSGNAVNLVALAEGSTTVAVTVGSLTTLLHVTVAPVVASAVSIEIGTPVAKIAASTPIAEPLATAVRHVEVEHSAETTVERPPAKVEHTSVPVKAPMPADGARTVAAPAEAAHAGEGIGREAAKPVAPPAPVAATTQNAPAAA